MAINYTTLKTELQTNPTAIANLTTVFNAGQDAECARLLNAVNAGIAINRGVVPAYEIMDATVQAEWASLTAAEKQRYQTITGAGDVNTLSANTRAAFQAMFGPATTTRVNLTALLTRAGSRAEELFGIGTVLTHTDVAVARAS